MKRNREKTKEQLVNELAEMQQRINELEALESEHEQVKSELEKAQQRLRTIFESVSDGVAVTDTELNITDINEAGLRMFGYDHKEEFVGRSGLEFISPKEHTRAMVDMQNTLEKGYIGTLEYTFLDKKGMEFLAEYNVMAIKDESGSPAGFVATMRDTTERKKAENELRKFKTISDKAGYGVVIVDLEGNVNYVNPSFARMHGYKPGELVGKHLSIFHTEQQMAEVRGLLEKFNREGTYVAEEVRHKRKDGTGGVSSARERGKICQGISYLLTPDRYYYSG
jgi:PAS domain S-box-containing protein